MTLQAFPALLSVRGEGGGEGRKRLESEDGPSEAHDEKGAEMNSLFAEHNSPVLLYLLVARVIVRRRSAALVLFVSWVPSLNVSRQVTFTAEEGRRVVRRLPEADLDALAGR